MSSIFQLRSSKHLLHFKRYITAATTTTTASTSKTTTQWSLGKTLRQKEIFWRIPTPVIPRLRKNETRYFLTTGILEFPKKYFFAFLEPYLEIAARIENQLLLRVIPRVVSHPERTLRFWGTSL